MGTWHLDIDEAIRCGRIKAFYQPIVRVESGTCCSVEALARWQDPDRGLLLPQSFVPQLEEEHEVYKLDVHMMDLVCRDIRERLDAGLVTVPVSVNFSRADFSSGDPVREVVEAVRRHGVPRDKLIIEITESIAGDNDLLGEKIHAFKDSGFIVWMDDFGTGYSSLSSLSDLNFDGLKIDMQFLMAGTQKARVIMKHAVAMARELGLGTLAEGVQSEGDVDFLREIGCERAQGSYFSQPRPLEELLAHLEAHGIMLA